MFKLGIVGAGGIAAKMCGAVRISGVARVAAMASKDLERAKAFAAGNEVPAFYGSYAEMLESEALDGVYVATTHNFHYENILLCLRHGLPVLCEKPLALTKRQAREVFALAAAQKVFLMEAMWSRFLPATQQARKWVREGRIGAVLGASYYFGFVGRPGTRIYDKALAGGALYDVGVYGIETLTYLVNQPLRAVTGACHRNGESVDVTDIVTLTFDPCIASVHCSIGASMPSRAEIFGSEGRIVLPPDAFDATKAVLVGPDGSEEVFESPHPNGFTYELEHFVSGVRDGLLYSDVMPPEDTIACAAAFDTVLGTR